MSEAHDPRKLFEGDAAFAELQAGLRTARTRGPSVEQAARMRTALGLAQAGDAITKPDAAARVSAGRSGWLKLIVCGVLAIGAALGVWRARVSPHVPGLPAPRVAMVGAPASPAAAPSPGARAPEPALPAATVQGTAGSGMPHGASARPRHAAARDVRGAERNPGEAADPAAELALLKRAKAGARSAPQHALVLVAEHEQRFPHGVLVEEREVIAIEALIASGERAAAEARAARFFTRFPSSAHARRVRALLTDDSAAQSHTNGPSLQHQPR